MITGTVSQLHFCKAVKVVAQYVTHNFHFDVLIPLRDVYGVLIFTDLANSVKKTQLFFFKELLEYYQKECQETEITTFFKK